MDRPVEVCLAIPGDLESLASQWLAGIGSAALVIRVELSTLHLNIRTIRAQQPQLITCFVNDVSRLKRRDLYALAALLIRVTSRNTPVRFADISGRVIQFRRGASIFWHLPRLAAEYLTAPLAIGGARLKNFRSAKYSRFARRPRAINRVLYLRSDDWGHLQAGGSVAHVAGIVNALADRSVDVRLLSTSALAMIDITKISLTIASEPAWFRNHNVARLLAIDRRLKRIGMQICSGWKPDLIYQRYSMLNRTGLELRNKLGVPLVLEYNGSFTWMGQNWARSLSRASFVDQVELENLHGADLVVVVSNASCAELVERGIPTSKILLTPNAVDAEYYNPAISGEDVRNKLLLSDKVVVGFIGTFGLWHGAEILAKAIPAVLASYPSVHFLFVGDGEQRPQVEGYVRDHISSDNVTFTGIVPQESARDYLAVCDILVSPHVPNEDGTAFFGSPTKLFEYMAMGRAIVASRLGQIGDVLEDENSALLVPPTDSTALAEAIVRLIGDSSLRRQLGQAARQAVLDKFTWSHQVERVMNALLEDSRT